MSQALTMSDTKDANKKLRVSHLRWVRVDDTVPAPLGQRYKFDAAWANKIAADFKLEALGYPVLSFRDGVYYIVDGQHRLAAARIFGFGDDLLQCEVYEGLTQEEEAELFLQRDNIKPIDSFSKFKAAVHAQRPDELAIYRTIVALGLTIGPVRGETSISAVASIRKVAGLIGVVGLSRVVRTLRDAYGPAGFEGPVLVALSLVLHRYDGQIDDTLMVARMANTPGGFRGLMQPAAKLRVTTGSSLTECIAASIVGIYNREQRAKKLAPWWQG